MAPHFHHPSGKPSGPWQWAYEYRTFITVLLATLALGFALFGRIMTLNVTGMGYLPTLIAHAVSSFSPNSVLDSAPSPHWAVSVGNVLGMFATICSGLLIGIATMGHSLSRLWTKKMRRRHTIVIGETALANRITGLLRKKGHYTIQVFSNAPIGASKLSANQIVGNSINDLVNEAGLKRAKTIIIDAGNDATTLSIGRSVRSALAAKGHNLERFVLRIADPLLADATAQEMLPQDASAPPRPLLFDENQIMAQSQLWTLPLFQVASALHQQRVHALILGFGDLGEKLFDQVMLTSMAGKLETPMVTVIDRDAASAESRFRSRRPGVLKTLDIAFVELDVGFDPLDDGEAPHGLQQILDRANIAPYTCTFVALPSDSETLQATDLLQRLKQRHGHLNAPIIFAQRSSPESFQQTAQTPWSEANPSDGVLPMALTDTDLCECLMAPEARNTLARLLHETYRKGSNAEGAAVVAWEYLPETYRRATLRAADHLPAKLWTLGVKYKSLANRSIKLSSEEASRLQRMLASEDAPVGELARIEHERWAIERKLDGWRFGPKRDNRTLVHNLLVPWEELQKQPDQVRKDVDQVITALQTVAAQSK
jgi:hypothetical protein